MKKILSIFTVSFALVFSSSAFANKIGVVMRMMGPTQPLQASFNASPKTNMGT